LLAFQLRYGVLSLALPLIAEALIKHQRQNVVLVVLPRCLAAENVRGAPQVSFKLLEGIGVAADCSNGVLLDPLVLPLASCPTTHPLFVAVLARGSERDVRRF
jgi:hypothetical protein